LDVVADNEVQWVHPIWGVDKRGTIVPKYEFLPFINMPILKELTMGAGRGRFLPLR
jgi:hypothetical protein